MISELRITDPARACVSWWETIPFLKSKTSIPFKPGLNILWGPNGSGKSTVLLAIAKMLHAEQGGSTAPTGSSFRDLFSHSLAANGDEGYLDGVLPIHDGQALMHFNPTHAVGLIHGAFDDDFFLSGVRNALFKGSSGQTTLQKFDAVLKAIITREWPAKDYSKAGRLLPSKAKTMPAEDPEDCCSGNRERKAWLITQTLQGTLPIGPRTILLDEPDRSLDIPFQWGLWKRLAQEKDIQIIAASHSLCALNIPGAHYIEFAPGYLNKSKGVVDFILKDALAEMAGLKDETRSEILTLLNKRLQANTPPTRDPRVDPQKGDVVRVSWRGGVQIREVLSRDENTVKWKSPTRKGGSRMGLTKWRKLCSDGSVIKVGTK